MKKCRACGKDGFTGPTAIHKHKISGECTGEAPRVKRKYTRRVASANRGVRKVRRAILSTAAARELETLPQTFVGTCDPEAKLLSQVVDLFANAGTDREADFRVLEYLNKRFGPEAYAEEEPG